MRDHLCPNFCKETLDTLEGIPSALVTFSTHSKKRGWDDLVLATYGDSASSTGVRLYRNPKNLDLDEGPVWMQFVWSADILTLSSV